MCALAIALANLCDKAAHSSAQVRSPTPGVRAAADACLVHGACPHARAHSMVLKPSCSLLWLQVRLVMGRQGVVTPWGLVQHVRDMLTLKGAYR